MGNVVKMTVKNSTLPERISKYAEVWLDTKSKQKAYEAAGYSCATASNAYNFHKQHWPAIQKEVQMALGNGVPLAIATMVEIMKNGRSETARTKCAIEILDRAGFDKTTKVQIANEEPKDQDQLKSELRELLAKNKGDFEFITDGD